MGERYLKSVRLLAECLQGYIIATLGNTSGMSYKELGERTLITKGTLTGVIERLTDAGDAVFRDVFPKVVAHGKQLFKDYSEAEFDAMDGALTILRERIGKAGRPFPLFLHQKEET